MTIAIAIILGLIAAYSAFVWLNWVAGYQSGRLTHDYTFRDVQASAIGSGLCCIVALGFLGLLLK